MIANAAFVLGWVAFLGTLAQRAAGRRGLHLHAAPTYWIATACIAAPAAATSCATLSIVAALVVLAVAAVVDAQSGFIFDPLVVAGTVGVVVVAVLEGAGISSLFGAAVACGAVFCMWALTLGRGIGLGDVKLAAVVGAGFGQSAASARSGFHSSSARLSRLPALLREGPDSARRCGSVPTSWRVACAFWRIIG